MRKLYPDLYVDIRGNEPWKEKLLQDPELNCFLTDLGEFGGDIRFYQGSRSVGLELKTVLGLLHDMGTTRLQDQLQGLRNAVDEPILVIVGYVGISFPGARLQTRLGIQPKRSYFALENWILSRIREGIVVYRVPREGTEVLAIKEILAYYAKPEHLSAWKPLKVALPIPERDPRLQLLVSLEGIGLEKARAILKAYPNIIDFFTASYKEMQKVEGLGPKLANKILITLGRRENDPGYFVYKEPEPLVGKSNSSNV